MDNNRPVLGVTLYSFTNEWKARLFTLEQMIEKVTELGLGPAVEVVGFQSFRSYPDVSAEFARHFRDLLEKHGLVPSCLGGNVDVGRRRDRPMTPEEMLSYVERQLDSAKKLGFPVLRIQHFVGPKFFEQIAPLAERARVQVCPELHSPMTADHPEVIALREVYDRLGTEYLGFVPDFSSTMVAVPEVYWDSIRRHGASEAMIEAIKTIWITSKPAPEKFAALAEIAERFDADAILAGQLNRVLTMFGHMPVDSWRGILPYVKHIHGKFYGVDADGRERSIPYPDLMKLLSSEGYHGTISAEWEGHAFTEEAIGFNQVNAWHAMCKRLLTQ